MTEQTNFSQLADEGVQNDTNDESETSSSTEQDTSDSDDSNSDITKLVAPAVEEWVSKREQREENYGYFHLFVVAESDLSGVEQQLRYEEKINLRVAENDTSHHYGGRWGHGGVHADEARDRLIDWKLSELATPYHPDHRTVSAANLRIFVADPAYDLLAGQDIAIESLVETLNTLDEHEPSNEQLALRQEHIEVRESVKGPQSPLDQEVRAIEATIRARFGLCRRYGGDTPEPDPDYEDHDLDILKTELESARNELAQTEQRKVTLRQKIADEKAQWIENMRSQL